MKKEILWDLFRATGKIEYYIKYKQIEKEETYGSNSGKEI